jgi:hypothetical protein
LTADRRKTFKLEDTSMTTTYAVWLHRYHDYYDSDQDRRAGYRDYLVNRAATRRAFGLDSAERAVKR